MYCRGKTDSREKIETSESRQEENQTAQADSTKRTVVLDSGHGGFDPGKESSDGILEKHINLAIAERLKELLEKEGIRVVMTRTDDNGLYTESDSNKKIADMKKRCAIIDRKRRILLSAFIRTAIKARK